MPDTHRSVQTVPLRVLAILLATAFATEVGIMLLLPTIFTTRLSAWVEPTLDAFLLVLVLAPAMWWLIVRPLQREHEEHDITEHKRAEETIRDLSKFPSENPSPVLRIARDGTLLYMNEAGLSLLPQWHLEVGHASPPLLRDAVFWSLDNESTQVLDLEHGERVYSFVVAPIVAGRYANLYGRDITERKRAEARRERLAALVEASPDFIGFADPNTTQIQYINKYGRTMIGLGEDEDIEKLKIRDVHPAWMNKRLGEVVLPAAVRDGVWEGEGAFLHRDGREIPVLMALMALKTANGEVDIFYTVSRDITEKKRLEAQFLQSQKMESVGRLAGGISHDFNNLLIVINGTAELAAMHLREDDPLRTDLEEIRSAGERAASMTRQLLAFSRKQIMEVEALRLGKLVADMQGMLQRLIGENITLTVVPATDVDTVRADRGLLEQVVLNLVVNAQDAMPDGGTLTIETRVVEIDEAYSDEHPSMPPGPYVMLSVNDTGVGMDETTRERMFEPFFTTKETGKGTGLGLSTVYGIVQQSGGSIWVDSEPGRGTIFTIYLPRIAEVELVARILKSAGYTVLPFRTAEEALLAQARPTGPVHLLVTDVVLPGMSGRELATRLAKVHPEIKCLYTSGYTDDAILRHGVLNKTSHFLSKPYTVADLRRKIRQVLDSPER